MNRGLMLFVGALLALAASFWGVVLVPQLQVGWQDLRAIEPLGELYPSGRVGLARLGESAYRAQGCVECHTQQIRPRELGGDIERGWGLRRTVAQDYLRDHPVQLGSLRMGPDLANVAARQPSAEWHFKHLYHPRSVVPNSTMPPYRFLFVTRKSEGAPAPEALPFEGDLSPAEGWEVLPTDEAGALVGYLLSLRADAPLFEAPLPRLPTNPPPAEAASSPAPTGAAATTPTNAAAAP